MKTSKTAVLYRNATIIRRGKFSRKRNSYFLNLETPNILRLNILTVNVEQIKKRRFPIDLCT